MNSYMVSLKYDFEDFRSKHWLYTDVFVKVPNNLRIIPPQPEMLQLVMLKLFDIAKWILRESKNTENDYPTAKIIANEFISPTDTCLYIDSMYYNNSLNIHTCTKTFKRHILNDTWSYYTLHILMDVYDMGAKFDHRNFYMNESVLDYVMPNVYKLFLNITIKTGSSSIQ